MKTSQHRFAGIIPFVRNIASMITADKITVYAAQASFFVIISAVPFISLLVSIIGLLIPADVRGIFSDISIPESLASVVGTVLDDLWGAPNVPLLSVSAVTTLWTASKGTAAIRKGYSRSSCTIIAYAVAGIFKWKNIKRVIGVLAGIAEIGAERRCTTMVQIFHIKIRTLAVPHMSKYTVLVSHNLIH